MKYRYPTAIKKREILILFKKTTKTMVSHPTPVCTMDHTIELSRVNHNIDLPTLFTIIGVVMGRYRKKESHEKYFIG